MAADNPRLSFNKMIKVQLIEHLKKMDKKKQVDKNGNIMKKTSPVVVRKVISEKTSNRTWLQWVRDKNAMKPSQQYLLSP